MISLPAIELASAAAAVGSFIVTGWVALFARRQIRSAESQARSAENQVRAALNQVEAARRGNYRSERTAQIQLVMHFASDYHRIRGDGLDFASFSQMEQFWGMHYLEFFYFKTGDIPTDIFGLWIVELATLYTETNGEAWKSHQNFLERFAGSFEDMYDFFRAVNTAAGLHPKMPTARASAVLDIVSKWQGSSQAT